MRRLLSAFALFCGAALFGGLVAAQVNGTGGVVINGVLQTSGGAGTGSVTSVGVTVPDFMNVSGTNPITTSGTFVFGFNDVSAGAVLAGPLTGADDAPDFKAISGVAALPDLSNVTGVGTDLLPDRFGSRKLGSSSLPFETINFTDTISGYSNVSDTLPRIVLNTSGFYVGPGLGDAVDSGIERVGVATWRVSDTLEAVANVSSPLVVGPTTGDLTIQATAPASEGAGNSVNITASASTGSGNNKGGDIVLTPGAGIGTGTAGIVSIPLDSATVKMGAGSDVGFYRQGAGAISFGASGTPAGLINVGGAEWYASGTTPRISILGPYASATEVSLASGITIDWNATDTFAGSRDLGLARKAAGVLKVTNGSTGYGGLKLNTLEALSNVSSPLFTVHDASGYATTFAGSGTQTGDIPYTLPPIANVSGVLELDADTMATGWTPATDANTASTIVKRDASGNFSAGTITANLTGNASGTAATFTGNLGGDISSSGMTTTLAATYKTHQAVWTFYDADNPLPATLDIPSIFPNLAGAIHITKVACYTDVADGAAVNLTNAGDTVLDGDLTCQIAGASSTSFLTGKDAVAADALVGHVTVSVDAALHRLTVVMVYTKDAPGS